MNGALKNTMINWTLLHRLPIQNHSKSFLTDKWQNKVKHPTQNSKRLEFITKTRMLNPIKNLGSIKSFCLSSLWSVKSTSSSIRYKPLKIWTWTKRPETILEIRRKTTFLIYNFLKTFRPLTNVLKYRGTWWNFIYQNLENQNSFDTLKIWTNIYATSDLHFFRIISGKQLGPDAFEESRLVMTLLTNLQVRGIVSNIRLILEEVGKKMPESSRLVFLERILAKKFCFIRFWRQNLWAIERGG